VRVTLFLAALVAAPLLSAGPAGAAPADFPDVDSYPAVNPADYEVFGAHPSLSGWVFSTPAGLRCRDSLIAELGVFCQGPVPGVESAVSSVGVSLTKPAEFGGYDGPDDGPPFRLLPTGSKIAASNGVVCAVLDDATLACRAAKPDWWAPDTQDPPDRHYGEHGFVVGPDRSWGY